MSEEDFFEDVKSFMEENEAAIQETFWNTCMDEAEHNKRTKRSPVLGFRTLLTSYVPAVRRPNIPYVFLSQGRPRINSLGAVQVRTGADPRAIVYRSRGIAAGLPPRPRYK